MGALRSEATEGEGSFAMPPEGVHVWDMGRLQLLVDAELIWAHWEQRQQKVRRVACLPLASIAMPLGECACGVWGGCNSWHALHGISSPPPSMHSPHHPTLWKVLPPPPLTARLDAPLSHLSVPPSLIHADFAFSLPFIPSRHTTHGISSSPPPMHPCGNPSLRKVLPSSSTPPCTPGTLRIASARLLPPCTPAVTFLSGRSFLLHPSLHDWMPLSFSPISLPPSSIPVDFASPFRPPFPLICTRHTTRSLSAPPPPVHPSHHPTLWKVLPPPPLPSRLDASLSPSPLLAPLVQLEAATWRVSSWELPRQAPGEEAHATRAHLENALAACRLLNSPDEFRRLLAEYVRLLTK
ncbi:unnamed protein product [Closterium sp. NIES-65]|nr:unnamed protein product [Closterium sp. NIES-65]